MAVSKSRNVCGYVKWVAKLNKARVEYERAKAEVAARQRKLTGGQLGEAARILSSAIPNISA